MISRENAIKFLAKIFDNTSDDSLTDAHIFHILKREKYSVEENKAWFTHKVTDLKRVGLVKPVYVVRNYKKTLCGLQLTEEGYAALGREMPVIDVPAAPQPTVEPPKEVLSVKTTDLDGLMNNLRKIKLEYKEFDIQFDIRIRG